MFDRFKDRGYKMDPLDENGKLNTKKVLQEEVNALYTGAEMASDQIYS